MSEKTTPAELKPEVLAMSEELKKVIKYDKEGQGTIEDGVYKKMLPEGMTEKDVRKVYDYNVNFVAALAHAAGTESVEVMAKNKSVNDTYVKVPTVGRDFVEIVVDRKRETTNPRDRDNKIITYGATRVAMRNFPGANAGQLKAARGIVAELAMKKIAGS